MDILHWVVVVSTVFGVYCADIESSQCGQKDASDVVSRISGGTESNQNEWPWLASLVYKSENKYKNRKFFCSATLISLKSVLTAAHCMQEKFTDTRMNPSDFVVQLGRHNLSDNDEFNKMAKVLEPIIIIAMHPDWNPTNFSSYRYDADIALLIAEKVVEPSPSIKPICLPDRDIPNVIGTTVGWGFSSDDKVDVEEVPRQAEVERVPPEDCFLEDHKLAQISSKRTFCVKGVDEDTGVCRGDSGGGLFVKTGSAWSIHGIVSSGLIPKKCPITKHSVYSKLSAFGDWIREGIEQFYPVQFHLGFIERRSYHSTSRHNLTIHDGTLRKRAYLSTVGGSVHDEVDKLDCEDQNWGHLPNNIGYLFPNLRQLIARNLQVIPIDRAHFKGLEKLEGLSLENNLIEHVPSSCFHDLKNDETININNNRLKAIHAETFTKNPSLEFILLNNNQIESIKPKNFKNKNVVELYLDRWDG